MVFLGTTSCCGTAWPVSLGFSGLFDDFAFFGVLAVDIEALLEGCRRRFCGLKKVRAVPSHCNLFMCVRHNFRCISFMLAVRHHTFLKKKNKN
jgi:hypothetical protein